jgi:hypothetical protein
MDGRTMTLLFGLMGTFVAVVSMVLSRSRSDALERRRLDVIEQGLAHPALDEATRSELLRLLAEQQRSASAGLMERLGRLMPLGRLIWYGVAWFLFVFGGSMLAVRLLELWDGIEPRVCVPMAVTGFAMLTLPLALGELARRGPASTVTR